MLVGNLGLGFRRSWDKNKDLEVFSYEVMLKLFILLDNLVEEEIVSDRELIEYFGD